MSSSVFNSVEVYPQQPDRTLVIWDLHPDFNAPGTYTFEIEYSRSGNPDDTDWVVLANVINTSGTAFYLSDDLQRTWSTNTQWFYRVKLTIGTDVFYSYVVNSLGGMCKEDFLKMKEIFRQEALRMTKKVGNCGWLFRRKHWGERSPETVDFDTDEVVVPVKTVDYGTGYIGGYWEPFKYCIDMNTPDKRHITQTNVGTLDNQGVTGRGLAYPLPRSYDVWVDCSTGDRYYIHAVNIVAEIRNIPIIVNMELRKAPVSDIIYELPLP